MLIQTLSYLSVLALHTEFSGNCLIYFFFFNLCSSVENVSPFNPRTVVVRSLDIDIMAMNVIEIWCF